MGRFKLILGLLAFSICLNSCTDEKFVGNNVTEINDLEVNVTDESFMRDVQVTEGYGDFGKYSSYLIRADATIGISSSRYYPLGDEAVMAYYDPVHVARTKGAMADIDAENFLMNGRALFSPLTKSESGQVYGMFGGPISFSLRGAAVATKGNDGGGVELYAPEIVRIEFPTVTSEQNRYPLCYYKNFVVRWNADSKNRNGILIIVRWSGMMVFGEDYSSSYICRAVRSEDTGSFELDESMFAGIPDAALCSLCLLRGDFEDVEIDDAKLRVLAETHDELDFVLVRSIETK